MDYRSAGVDIEAGRAFVNRIRNSVKSTYRSGVLGNLGGFGGCFEIPAGYQQPVLISGTDGVGTKLKLAHSLDRHHTVGIDLVAMCANDILTSGAEPLYFLDYLATGKLNPEQLAQVVEGIAEGCCQSGCALLGGETAEMPGFYAPGEYDLAGFCVGIVEKSQLLNGSQVQVGDVAIGLASSGVHSNGFSLVRKIVSDRGYTWGDRLERLSGASLGDVLLTPTRIYVRPILDMLGRGLEIHGMAHITGGGLPENLPRCLGENQSIQIDSKAWKVPVIFDWLAVNGEVESSEMFDTFNMGIGFVILVPSTQTDRAIELCQTHNIEAWAIGEVIRGTGELKMLVDR
jgi:phosphoribosylformylglycinamidine cyclo-ligase